VRTRASKTGYAARSSAIGQHSNSLPSSPVSTHSESTWAKSGGPPWRGIDLPALVDDAIERLSKDRDVLSVSVTGVGQLFGVIVTVVWREPDTA
jgi:hypothetical protein